MSLAVSVGDSVEFLALREHRPGDPLARVHWKSFARIGKPIVREYQDEFFERHALVLDTAGPNSEDAAFEEAVALAASFVYTLDTHECLLDLLFIGGEVHAYTAGRGQLQPEHLLEVLAGVGPGDPAAFPALASAVMACRPTLCSVIVILPAWDEARRSLASCLRASGLGVRALLVREERAAAAAAPPRHWPGEDSEFYAVERALPAREPDEPHARWFARIAPTLPENRRSTLAEALAPHSRYRFDPAGIGAKERVRLREACASILPAASSEPA